MSVRVGSVGGTKMKFGSCMCFASFTVGLLFRIARKDGEIFSISPEKCYEICCCAFSLSFIEFIADFQKNFSERVLESLAQDCHV